ncbi:MAG: glycosyltransferase family 2 protein [Bacteroidia bacterium]
MPDTPLPAVTVVILNWNGRAWLQQFLPSVLASTYPALDVLLVDNGSTDDSLAWVQAHLPRVRVLALAENHGFAEGNNRALPHIHTPYFVLLNSDVEVAPGWLEPLVARLEAEPDLAAVQPRVLAWHRRDHFEYAGAAGGYIDSLGYPFCRGRVFDHLEQDQGQYDRPVECFWATGACMALRKTVVDEIGLFEGWFFAHMEEIDFCWRAWNSGYRIACEPASIVWHVGGGTLPQGNPRKTFLNARNGLALLVRNLPTARLLPTLLARLVLDGVWGLKAALGGDWGSTWAIVRAHGYMYRHLGAWLRSRRATPRHLGPHVFRGSIVWQYFIRRRRTWSDLMQL